MTTLTRIISIRQTGDFTAFSLHHGILILSKAIIGHQQHSFCAINHIRMSILGFSLSLTARHPRQLHITLATSLIPVPLYADPKQLLSGALLAPRFPSFLPSSSSCRHTQDRGPAYAWRSLDALTSHPLAITTAFARLRQDVRHKTRIPPRCHDFQSRSPS